ncbi:DgyrCDS10039 [Dimorphilus gyrociliatus]|uniref:DgyrCDS10039 n=1 Tax=Dimorphilus gyrociliatus TaxID=2664684 RepID=A0A7I8VZ88_9ANNE|nr:DgyrCDS10039 [Dimorphilus gyrociliatus]
MTQFDKKVDCQFNSFTKNIAVYTGRSNFDFTIDSNTFDYKGSAFGIKDGEYQLIGNENGIVDSQKYRYKEEGSGNKRKIIFTQPTFNYSDNLYFDLHTKFLDGYEGVTLVTRVALVILSDFTTTCPNDSKQKVLLNESNNTFSFDVSVKFQHYSPALTCEVYGGLANLNKELEYTRQDFDKPLQGSVKYSITIRNFFRGGTDVKCYFSYDTSQYVDDNEKDHMLSIPPNKTVGITYQFRTETNQPTFFSDNDIKSVTNTFSIDIHYGPEDVSANLHPLKSNFTYCFYKSGFVTLTNVTWTVNEIEQNETTRELDIKELNERPLNITCKPCVKYEDNSEKCVLSETFTLEKVSETENITSIGYGVDKDDDTKNLLIADANGIVDDQKHRYSLKIFNETWKVTFTQETQSYEDNAYFSCISKTESLRAVFVLLSNYECDKQGNVDVLHGDKMNFVMSTNFTHFSPFIVCQSSDEFLSITKTERVDIFNMIDTYEALKGFIEGQISVEGFDKKPANLTCSFTFDPEKDLDSEQYIRLSLMPPIFSQVSSTQPSFHDKGDQSKLACNINFNVQYGPDSVTITEIDNTTVRCQYKANYSNRLYTNWTINGTIVNNETKDILDLSSYHNVRPIFVTCRPSIEFYNSQINSSESEVFAWGLDAVPPTLSPPPLDRHIPSNLALYEDQDKPFQFFCHGWPAVPPIIDYSSYGPTDDGNDKKLIADRDGIVPGESHRYQMEVDEYFSRVIIYNASVKSYEDNAYYECATGKEAFRSAFVVLSDFNCHTRTLFGVEDLPLEFEISVNFTHFAPLFKCESDTNVTLIPDYNYYMNDPNKPMKGTVTGKVTLGNPSRNATYLQCYFTYDSEDYVFFNELNHLLSIPPAQSFADSLQPKFAYEEDKDKVSCRNPLNIQFGPDNVEIKENDTVNTTVECHFIGHFKEYKYTNWIVNGELKFNRTQVYVDLSPIEIEADITCEPCVEFFNEVVRCKESSNVYHWKPIVTPPPPTTEAPIPIRESPTNLVIFEGRKNFSFSCSPFPANATIIGDSVKYDNQLKGVLISNETSILPEYDDLYDITIEDDGTRTVYYTETSDKYRNNYYHDCVIESAANIVHYRGAVVELTNYHCSNEKVYAIEHKVLIPNMNVSFTHFSPKFQCTNDRGEKMKTLAVSTYDFGDSKPMKGYTLGNIDIEDKDLKSLKCMYTYDRTEYVLGAELTYFYLLPPLASFVSDRQPYFYYEEDRDKLICEFDIEVQYGPTDVNISVSDVDKNIVHCNFTGRYVNLINTNWTVNGELQLPTENFIDLSNLPSPSRVTCEPCLEFQDGSIQCKQSEEFIWTSPIPYISVSPTNFAVYQGRAYFSFSCSPYPEDNKIVGNAFKVENNDISVYMANENRIIAEYANDYELEYNGAVRTIFYTKPTDSYKDHLYHECVLKENRYRATLTVLSNFQCQDDPLIVIERRNTSMIMRVDFVHYSPEVVCIGNEGLLSQTFGITEYTKTDVKQPMEGFTNAYVTINDRNVKNIQCAFMYDPSNYVLIDEAIHAFSLPPEGSFIDLFQPTMAENDDIEKVTCKRPVEVQYGPENIRCEETAANSRIVKCIYTAKVTRLLRVNWTVNNDEVNGQTDETIDLTDREEELSVKCLPCVEFYNSEINCAEGSVLNLPAIQGNIYILKVTI